MQNISTIFNKPTSAQQYIWHTLSTLAVGVIFTGGTALLQFLGNHPFNLSLVLSVASVSFGGALLQALLTLGKNGVFLQQAYQALVDTVQRIENIHLTPQTTVQVTTTSHTVPATIVSTLGSITGAPVDTTLAQPLSISMVAPLGDAMTGTAIAPQFAQPSPMRHFGDSQLLPAVILPQTDATPSELAAQG
ncbi:MAG TPA: hypothetical protein VFA10_14325 [Ktedonobacteraceae bacterium]|nr:hypothetical protein [Ktedonobacteraceae bacterium]